MNTTKIFFLGLLVWFVCMIYNAVTCGWLFNWVYEIPPNIWKTKEEILSVWNIIGIDFFAIINAWIFVFIYALIYEQIPFDGIKKGLIFGSFVWLIGSFANFPPRAFYSILSNAVIIYWILHSLVSNWIAGIIVGAWYTPKEKVKV